MLAVVSTRRRLARATSMLGRLPQPVQQGWLQDDTSAFVSWQRSLRGNRGDDLTVFMCALWFVHFLRRHLPSLKLCGRSQWRAALWLTKGTRDPVSREIAEKLDQRRLERFVMAVKVYCCVEVLIRYLVSHYFLTNTEDFDLQSVEQYLFFSETFPALFYMGFLIACDMCPSLVTRRNLDLANALLHGMWACRMVTTVGGDYARVYKWNKYWMLVCRLWQGLIFGNAWLSILLNGCVVLVDCFVSTYFLETTQNTRNYISREFGMFFASSCVIWTFGQIQLAQPTALVSVQTMDTAATLVRGLLDCICDVVVKLDHELHLTEPQQHGASRLASELSHRHPGEP